MLQNSSSHMTYTVVKQFMIVATAINFAARHLGMSNYKKLRTSNTFCLLQFQPKPLLDYLVLESHKK